jgi:hypothetical protein
VRLERVGRASGRKPARVGTSPITRYRLDGNRPSSPIGRPIWDGGVPDSPCPVIDCVRAAASLCPIRYSFGNCTESGSGANRRVCLPDGTQLTFETNIYTVWHDHGRTRCQSLSTEQSAIVVRDGNGAIVGFASVLFRRRRQRILRSQMRRAGGGKLAELDVLGANGALHAIHLFGRRGRRLLYAMTAVSRSEALTDTPATSNCSR